MNGGYIKNLDAALGVNPINTNFKKRTVLVIQFND